MYIHHPYLPSNRIFRQAKLTVNKQRDARNTAALRALGYIVLTIWECQLKTILTTHHIPNLPPKAEASTAPTYSPLPDTTLMAADSSLSSSTRLSP